MDQSVKDIFNIQTTSGVPIYRQLADRVRLRIATGDIDQGIFLPSVRQVAVELAINPMTVSKAYSILESEGVIEHVRGQGMRVILSQHKGLMHEKKQQDNIIPLIKEVVLRAKQLSLSSAHVKTLIDKIWKDS